MTVTVGAADVGAGVGASLDLGSAGAGSGATVVVTVSVTVARVRGSSAGFFDSTFLVLISATMALACSSSCKAPSTSPLALRVLASSRVVANSITAA